MASPEKIRAAKLGIAKGGGGNFACPNERAVSAVELTPLEENLLDDHGNAVEHYLKAKAARQQQWARVEAARADAAIVEKLAQRAGELEDRAWVIAQVAMGRTP